MVFTLSENIVLEVIRAVAVVVPSYFVFKGIAKKSRKISNDGFIELSKKVDEGFQKNTDDHKSIFSVIRCMDDEKLTLNQIRHAISDASSYISSEKVKKILDMFVEGMVAFTKEILETGLPSLTVDQVLIKYSNLRDTIADEAHFQFRDNPELIKKYFEKIEEPRALYLNEIGDIFGDNVNNRNSRFSTETLRYVQKIGNTTVKFLQENPLN